MHLETCCLDDFQLSHKAIAAMVTDNLTCRDSPQLVGLSIENGLGDCSKLALVVQGPY